LSQHETVLSMQEFAYTSTGWQPILFILFFAAINKKERSEELVTSMAIALAITTCVFTFIPTLGPADMHRMHAQQGDIIRTLRSLSREPLIMTGIVSFPSYHTGMAILYTAAHRGLWSFSPILCLNIVVLTAVPYTGDHYLVDMPAGALIAALSYFITVYILCPSGLPETGNILVSGKAPVKA